MRILAIAPHPDDETLGCGGALLNHKRAGDRIHWCIVTEASEPRVSRDFLDRRHTEIDSVAAAYGFDGVTRLGLPTTLLDTLPIQELIAALAGVIEETRPDCVYLNHANDVHSDHRAVFVAAMSALKPFYTRTHGVKRILSYEVLSSTDASLPTASGAFNPTAFCDISAVLDRKLEIMSLYQSELQPYPLPRSLETIRALARFRGGTIGAEYAEGYVLLREVF